MQKPWKIWVEYYDEKRVLTGASPYFKDYESKEHAEFEARRRYGNRARFRFIVSQTNPW